MVAEIPSGNFERVCIQEVTYIVYMYIYICKKLCFLEKFITLRKPNFSDLNMIKIERNMIVIWSYDHISDKSYGIPFRFKRNEILNTIIFNQHSSWKIMLASKSFSYLVQFTDKCYFFYIVFLFHSENKVLVSFEIQRIDF